MPPPIATPGQKPPPRMMTIATAAAMIATASVISATLLHRLRHAGHRTATHRRAAATRSEAAATAGCKTAAATAAAPKATAAADAGRSRGTTATAAERCHRRHRHRASALTPGTWAELWLGITIGSTSAIAAAVLKTFRLIIFGSIYGI